MSGDLRRWQRMQRWVLKFETWEATYNPSGRWYARLKFLRMRERIVNEFRSLDERLTVEGVL